MRKRKDQSQSVEDVISYPHEIDGVGIVYPQSGEEPEAVPEVSDTPEVRSECDAETSDTEVD